ncbi:MAG: hypothetical protein AB1762_05915 [Gemmatimonadota bacterium]
MFHNANRLTLISLGLLSAGSASGQSQGLPTSQPALLTIVREEVKVGRAADHAKHEAGWPAAFEKAKSPDYYLALVSMTGPNEAWYITPSASHTAMAEGMKRDDADPVLSAELNRLSRVDGDFLNGLRVIQAAARPDLSMGDYPDIARMRFWEITIFRVRPGHEAAFDAAAKAYRAATQRAAPSTRWRMYQVIAGMPNPTYIAFGSVVGYNEFDKGMSDGEATMRAFTAEEGALLEKFSKESLLNAETNRFRLDPVQSYVSKEVRATDPAFWMPKRATARAAGSQ